MTKVAASSHEHPDVVTVAVDTGGTFTDLVARVDGALVRIKTPSTPDDPAEAVVTALRQLQERHHLPAGRVVALRHGTTVATNALLERAGAKVVLITNSGFEDVIALRRQDRPDLYALHPVVPEPLVPASARVGIDVRRGPRGECWRRLEPVGPWIERHRELLAGAEAFAVSLLHAWRDGEDERTIGEALAAAFPDTPLTLSHALSPVFREYERTSTALVNAYVAPMMNAYLRRLAAAVAPATLYVQGSSGKLLTVEEVARAPARTVLSGPAGGVQGAWRAGQRVGADRLLALDMGGTSTDVSLIEGAPSAVDTGGVATHPVRLPLLPIETIGAGGGSIAWVDGGGELMVGPRSAGAVPGPACYGRGGPDADATVTDAHVVLGRLPQLLGGAARCDVDLARQAIGRLARRLGQPIERTAQDIIDVTTASMARASKRVSMARGIDPKGLSLVAFGGAGGLHACEVADELGCTRVIFPPEPGVLSADGILHARSGADAVVTAMEPLDPDDDAPLLHHLNEAVERCRRRFEQMWGSSQAADLQARAELRYRGQTSSLYVAVSASRSTSALLEAFGVHHQRRYGYTLSGPVELVAIHVDLTPPSAPSEASEELSAEAVVGPQAIPAWSATLWLPKGWRARQASGGGWVCERVASSTDQKKRQDIQLEVHRNRLAAVAEQMGAHLQAAALSANIKERRDYSCAIFDAQGQMLVHAAHIPVHLGSTPASVAAAIAAFPEGMPGPVVLNDPFAGGTHLPDVTVVTPVALTGEASPRWYVANRAHHADVGGLTPGSMPAPVDARGRAVRLTIDDEGFRTGPCLVDSAFMARFAKASRTPAERRGDLLAQVAANAEGQRLLLELADSHGASTSPDQRLLDYSERRVRQALGSLPDGTWTFEDALDDDGTGSGPVPIRVKLTIDGQRARVDLSDAPPMCDGPLNAVRAIAVSATFYTVRAVASAVGGGDEGAIPANSGLMRPIEVITRPGTLVDAVAPAAVSSGNVETSQRLVDVLWGVFAQACPELMPAASCGTMNNVLMGGLGEDRWVHYETLAGGAGAAPMGPGADAIQCHMTNTRNTPIEALEHEFPVQIERYALRETRSEGQHAGGCGVVRAYRFLRPAQVTLVTERRSLAPWGLRGGGAGERGSNWLSRRDAEREALPGKACVLVEPGDVVMVETPGGGAWGPSR